MDEPISPQNNWEEIQPAGHAKINVQICVLFLLAFVSALVGCSTSLKEEYKTAALSVPACDQKPESVKRVSNMIGLKNVEPNFGQVLAMSFSEDSERLWIVYETNPPVETAYLLKVAIAEWRVERVFKLESDFNFWSFSKSAKSLVATRPAQCPIDWGVTRNGCEQLVHWSTEVGPASSVQRILPGKTVDLSFASSGDWIARADGFLSILDPLKYPSGTGTVPVNADDKTENVTTAIFNSSANLVAYATLENSILIEGWNGETLAPPYSLHIGPFQNEAFVQTKIENTPLKLAISPSTKWLAILSHQALELRNIEEKELALQSQTTLESGAKRAMEFDPTGSILAVGDTFGMKVYSVPDLKQIMDKSMVPVTAATFSPDGCLFAWGSGDGQIGITNSPRP